MSFDWHSYVTAWDAVASKNVECELIRIWESIHLNMYEIVFMLFYGCSAGNVGKSRTREYVCVWAAWEGSDTILNII